MQIGKQYLLSYRHLTPASLPCTAGAHRRSKSKDKGSKAQGNPYRLDRQETSNPRGLSKSIQSLVSRRGTPTSPSDETVLFDARDIKSFEANVAVLRCATAIVFPPKRRHFLSKMKDVFEPGEFQRLAR